MVRFASEGFSALLRFNTDDAIMRSMRARRASEVKVSNEENPLQGMKERVEVS